MSKFTLAAVKAPSAVLMAGMALALAFGWSNAAHAASAGADVSVTIQKAVAIAKVTDLAFGTVSVSTASGTATINAGTGATSSGGGVDTIVGASRAEFSLTGEPNASVSVGFSNSTATLTGPGSDMTVNLTVSNASPALNGSGAATVYVGGTLNVGANQTSGAYTGSFTVTANYP
ncbi:MAG: DUF4402 domain-containing protein [Alphaproteobacteria bacterium]